MDIRTINRIAIAAAIITLSGVVPAYASKGVQVAGRDIVAAPSGAPMVSLSWRPVIASSIHVTVNGVLQIAMLDYNASASDGTVKFNRPLSQNDAIQVDYRYDPAVAKQNPNAVVLPLSMRLMSTGRSSLTANMSYTGGRGSTPGVAKLGMNGAWKASAHQNLTAAIQFAPAASGAASRTASVGYNINEKRCSLNVGTTYTGTRATDGVMATTVKLAVQPTQTLAVTTDYTRKDVLDPAAGPDSDTLTVGARLQPIKPLVLDAKASTSTTGDATTTTDAVAAVLTPSSDATITAGLSSVDTPTSETRTTSVGLVTCPKRFLSLSTTYRARDGYSPSSTALLDTWSSRATVNIAQPLQVYGVYAQNPDDGGAPAPVSRCGGGIASHLGALTLSSDYTADFDPGTSTDPVCARFGLKGSLAFDRTTALSGGYADLTYRGTTARQRTYTVGLTHNLGSSLMVAISGSVKLQGSDTIDSPTSETANATIGLKF